MAPSRKERALAAEQAHVDRVHDRVDELRRQADRALARTIGGPRGSTFQATYERDVAAHHQARRAARFTFGDEEPLVFGRLDTDDGESLHIGRTLVTTADLDVLLVDWRAPASAAFYQATHADPRGVARRRTLTTRGRVVRDLDDEILDADAAETLGLEAVTGQGALLASLTRARTGRMRDIVATIQADQDRIIRQPLGGTLIVSGGPGTGKTVVALHRVAYLLYTHRDRLGPRGVLVIGPSRAFTDYIGNVLPSLGEERVLLRSIDGFVPGELTVAGWDDPEVAAVKGRAAMAEVVRRLLPHVLPRLDDISVTFEGAGVTVPGTQLEQRRERLLRARGSAPFHRRRAEARDAFVQELWGGWHAARTGRRGGVPPRDPRFAASVSRQPDVQEAVERFWPRSVGVADAIEALITGAVPVASIADGVLKRHEIALLEQVWRPGSPAVLRADDVPLADELADLLGPVDEPGRDGSDDGGIRLSMDTVEDIAAPELDDPWYRDFAHVVVDEAQDLTPMQWRMVARRGSLASWTVVGDLDQRARIAEPRSWDEIAGLIGRRQVTHLRLSTNYRTPAEVMELARAVLAAGGADPRNAPSAVRETGARPRLVRVGGAGGLADLAAEEAARMTAQEGTVAIIAPDELRPVVTSRVFDADLRGVRVLEPRTVKGLEFDGVVVVAPDRIASATSVGHHHLYVAVTRCTRELALVASADASVPGAEVCDEVLAR